MTMKKEIRLLHDNFIFYLTGLLMILGLKCYYRQVDCDSLLWILAPTARWVEFLSRIPLTYIPGTGYVNHSLRMVIAPSCSGVRFMIISFAMLAFSFVHLVTSPQTGPVSGASCLDNSAAVRFGALHAKVRGTVWIAASAFLSWLLTVFVNGLRIITAIYLPMYLEDAGLMRGMLTQDRLHTMIGVIVYFAALLTIYRLAGWFVQGTVRPARSPLSLLQKCVFPVFWYLTFTLGLPLLNRAGHVGAGEFTEFAILVMTGCALILLPYVVCSLRNRQRMQKRSAGAKDT